MNFVSKFSLRCFVLRLIRRSVVVFDDHSKTHTMIIPWLLIYHSHFASRAMPDWQERKDALFNHAKDYLIFGLIA